MTHASPETPIGKRSNAMRVWMLGGFRVSVGTRTIVDEKWRLRKAAALVKILALAPGYRIHRERAMDLLWPRLGRGAAANNLRHHLHRPGPGAGGGQLLRRDHRLLHTLGSPIIPQRGAGVLRPRLAEKRDSLFREPRRSGKRNSRERKIL